MKIIPKPKNILKFSNFQKINKFRFTITDYSYDTRDFLQKTHEYETKINDIEKSFSIDDTKIKGFATSEGTKAYSLTNTNEVHSKHFRKTFYNDLTISSLGIGTYLGPPDDINDFYVINISLTKIYNAIKSSVLSGGINVIDTAINFRYTKSQRVVGKVLKALINKYDYERENLIVSSKIGFVPEDAETGKRCHAFVSEIVEAKKMTMDDIVFDEKNRPVHCIHPEFLKSQLSYSLEHLGLETVDIMYLHNVFETQGAVINEKTFQKRLTEAFEYMEQARSEGKIKFYGMATWNSMRSSTANLGVHCNLQELVKLAEKVGGKDHGMRFVQVPINLMNPEAFVEQYQMFESTEGVIPGALTAIANTLEINLISTSPLLQGHIVNVPLENDLFNVKMNASKHLQVIRSIPAYSLKSSIIGMKQMNHIRENLEVMRVPPLTSQEFYEVLAPKKRKPFIEKEADLS